MRSWGPIVFGVMFGVILFLLLYPRPPRWKYWAGMPTIRREVVCIVWVRPEVSLKKSYKEFTTNKEIYAILEQVITGMPGAGSSPDAEKHELRIYFLNGENYYVPFTMEGGEFVGPNGRNKKLYQFLTDKEEAEPFFGSMDPEEAERLGPLMDEVFENQKKCENM